MTETAPIQPRRPERLLLLLPTLAVLAGCEGPLDYDLRGQFGGFSTAAAAQNATTDRPAADERGLITYPSYQVVVAQRGDTVADVATRVGLTPTELARFNGMEPSDPLRKDEILAMPRRAPTSIAPGSTQPGGVDIASLAGQAIEAAPQTSPNPGSVTTTTLQPTPRPAPVEVQEGPEPIRHKVVRGETAYTISRLYQVPVKSLAEWNGLGSDFAIREGQYLLIPLKDQPAPTRTAEVTPPGAGSATPTPPSATKPLPTEEVAPASEAVAAVPTVKVPEPTRQSDAALAYPLQGKIISTYSKGKNEGIDIAGTPGQVVKSAEAGTVAAITKDSKNIPIVVIRHSNKLLTLYVNVTDISVKKGETVKRGQPIAKLRDGKDAFLHFEVRNGYESLDPLPYLN
ncbi:peptidoglycan DD-metalloendopeptidase family protein [Phaeobacter sp. PT47_59]|uniref:peptidoglycan DD-metalloendopeptidase family protein n=1 Tax=Phaeobacter sp. PT47_59 TaxID=3029979 RepID=UPI00237FFE1A|nr:peptidoglycan DD-metalloendopeptidase family protein [Phaeobacter sp. PT47_59]MDE4174058.1 peptidoglycan DD-metalloendopeptidase family protein [Phaeobacter sp. PT47_59]